MDTAAPRSPQYTQKQKIMTAKTSAYELLGFSWSLLFTIS